MIDQLNANSPRPDLVVLGFDARGSGVVRNALRIARAARQAGLVVELWLAEVAGNLSADLPEGVVVRRFGVGSAGLGRTAKLALSVMRLARTIGQVQPRLILSSGNHMHLAASLAYKMAGKPGNTQLIIRASNATWLSTLQASTGVRFPRWIAAMVNATNRLQYGNANYIIAVCEELRVMLEHDLKLPSARLGVIANGVDVDDVRRHAAAPLDHPWLAAGDAPLIVAVGRLSRQKNFGALLEALAQVRKRQPVRLAIVGESIGRRSQQLQRQARHLGVDDAVLLAGFDANPFRWMRRAQVIAVTSRYEGSSNVVLEALALGRPVVAFRCPTGIAEVLEPVAAENVVPQGDVAALAARLAAVLAEPPHQVAVDVPVPKLATTLDAYVAAFQKLLADPKP
jgi:glycosyltransferase involved in cell wall biosynthesis